MTSGHQSPGRARTILRGIEKNHLRILVGPDAHAVELGQRLLGPHYAGITRRIAAKGM